MNALVLTKTKRPLEVQERPLPVLQDNESLVLLKAAALNRRDFWITQGMYPGIQLPMVLGSDGAGTVIESSGQDQSWVGKEVIINPAMLWGSSPAAQSIDFRILGMPDPGTFTTHVAVPTAQLFDRPQHLNWHESASLPLAGLTAYRALFVQGELQPGETVLVSGVGGGVATFAAQFAKAAGARVIVTSSAPEKINAALQIGASIGYDYNTPKWAKSLIADHGLVDLILDGAGGAGYAELIDSVAPGGRIVNYGSTQGPPEKLDMFKVFWKQLRIIGSTMGSPKDFEKMLQFVSQHSIRPVIHEVFPLDEGNAAMEAMRCSTQFGKLVLNTEVAK